MSKMYMWADNSYWQHISKNEWEILHGSHTIYEDENGVFNNEYPWSKRPYIAKREDATFISRKLLYTLTRDLEIPSDIVGTLEEVCYRMYEVKENNLMKRRFLVF